MYRYVVLYFIEDIVINTMSHKAERYYAKREIQSYDTEESADGPDISRKKALSEISNTSLGYLTGEFTPPSEYYKIGADDFGYYRIRDAEELRARISESDEYTDPQPEFVIYAFNSGNLRKQVEYFIDPTKQKILLDYFGRSCFRVERMLGSIDRQVGEYDRLIIDESVSEVEIAKIAEILALVEVVREADLQHLNAKNAELVREQMQFFKRESEHNWGKLSLEIRERCKIMCAIPDASEEAKVCLEYCLSSENQETLEELIGQLDSITYSIGSEGLLGEKHFVDLVPEADWFVNESWAHGTPHMMRVLINVGILARLLENQGHSINIEALEQAAVIHDLKREGDDAEDQGHGRRAGDWLWVNKNIKPTLDAETRRLASGIAHYHSIDDRPHEENKEIMTFKDADALDRYRFGRGALNWDYIRLPDLAHAVGAVARIQARMSNMLIRSGFGRLESVRLTARALGLLANKQEWPLSYDAEQSDVRFIDGLVEVRQRDAEVDQIRDYENLFKACKSLTPQFNPLFGSASEDRRRDISYLDASVLENIIRYGMNEDFLIALNVSNSENKNPFNPDQLTLLALLHSYYKFGQYLKGSSGEVDYAISREKIIDILHYLRADIDDAAVKDVLNILEYRAHYTPSNNDISRLAEDYPGLGRHGSETTLIKIKTLLAAEQLNTSDAEFSQKTEKIHRALERESAQNKALVAIESGLLPEEMSDEYRDASETISHQYNVLQRRYQSEGVISAQDRQRAYLSWIR